jgi:dihydroneopterin aldolase
MDIVFIRDLQIETVIGIYDWERKVKFVEESEYELVEALAEKICEIILKEFDVPWVRLTLNKPGAVRGSKSVGVMIERGQKPA